MTAFPFFRAASGAAAVLFSSAVLEAQEWTVEPLPPPTLGPLETLFGGSLLQWGPVAAHPRIHYSFTQRNGGLVRPGRSTSTDVQTISPGVTFGIGRFWTLDYAPSWTYYSDPGYSDTVDHRVSLTGGIDYGPWTFGLSQAYSASTPTSVETGRQVEQQSATTTASLAYRLSSAIQGEIVFNQHLRFVERLEDTYQWTITPRIRYQLSSRTTVSTGVALGYIALVKAGDMAFVTPDVAIEWRPGTRVSFQASLGREERWTLYGPDFEIAANTYSLSSAYQLTGTASVYLTGGRSLNTSYFTRQVVETTTWSAGLSQRLFGRLSLNLSYAEQEAPFIAITEGAPVVRDDSRETYSARLSTSWLTNGTASIFYTESKNRSNQSEFGYSSDSWGVEVGYSF